MKNSEDILQKLLDELQGLPDGRYHMSCCYHCRNARWHLSGRITLDEHRLMNTVAHLMAQIAMRKAESPF